VLSGFGTQFHGEDVAIKLWPCCRGTHRYIALALTLRDEDVTPAAIDTVAVTVRPPDDMLLLPERDRRSPATAIGAKFSIPFTFATTLLHGPPTLDSFSEERLTDPVTRALAARVFLADVGTELDAGARFSMRSGEVLVRAAAEPPVATAGNVALEDLAPKFSDCLEHSATHIVVQDFLRMLESFETEGGATELRRCIRS
jgi:MmgE/PrpD C-terminal domain